MSPRSWGGGLSLSLSLSLDRSAGRAGDHEGCPYDDDTQFVRMKDASSFARTR